MNILTLLQVFQATLPKTDIHRMHKVIQAILSNYKFCLFLQSHGDKSTVLVLRSPFGLIGKRNKNKDEHSLFLRPKQDISITLPL